MKKITTRLTGVPATQELRSGDFFLMPENPSPPVIASDLDRNVRQKTWIREIINGQTSYLEIEPFFGVYTVVAGTEIEMFIIAEDPSLVDAQSLGDDSNLQYAWKRNGASITEVNSINNGKGIPGLSIPAADVNANVAGTYVCEVSNAYGTTTSSRIRLEVIQTTSHPMMYRNLLKNGSSTQNWIASSDVITRAFLSSATITKHYGSLPGFSYYDFKADRTVGDRYPWDFRFCQGGSGGFLYHLLAKWYKKDKDLFDINIKSNPERDLDGWENWMLKSYPSNIVPNEDISSYKSAGFFPGLKWIDSYNRNASKVIGLESEVENQALTYITRDKIKFKKDGGRETSTCSQIVNIAELSRVVDGKVMGLNQINGQFFAYVGAGITGYKIKVTTLSGIETYNWYVLDPEEFFKRLTENKDNRIALVKDSVIEIIPLVEDTTQISIIAKSENDTELSRVDIDGPTAVDVFAIKEKAQLPLTWYPIFDMFITNNNDIQIFGQTYSNTDSLMPLMSPNPNRASSGFLGYDYKLRVRKFSSSDLSKTLFQLILRFAGYGAIDRELVVGKVLDIDLTNFMKKALGGEFSQWSTTVDAAIFGAANKLPLLYALFTFQPTFEGSLLDQITEIANPLSPIRKQYYDVMKAVLSGIDPDIEIELIQTPIYQNTSTSNNENTSITTLRNDLSELSGIDRNAAFFLKKIPYLEGGLYYPGPTYLPEWSGDTSINAKRTNKALLDYGAAAMFAVGTTFAIPKNTKTVEILITFTHNSEAMDDPSPELKTWTASEIYRSDFATTNNGKCFRDYGYPRCGVSLAKFLLFDQTTKVSGDFPSYYIPPPEATVLGLRKNKIYQDTNDTSQPGTFKYDFIAPNSLPEFTGLDIFSLNDALESYEKDVRRIDSTLTPGQSLEDRVNFEDTVAAAEDANTDRVENIESNLPAVDDVAEALQARADGTRNP